MIKTMLITCFLFYSPTLWGEPKIQSVPDVKQTTPSKTSKPISKSKKNYKKTKAQQVAIDNPSYNFNHLSFNGAWFNMGGVYVGGEKTPAKFGYLSLSYKHQTSSFFEYGLELGYLSNQSALKNYSGLIYLGAYKNYNQWSFSGGPLLGLSYINEITPLQKLSGMGLAVGAKVDVSYKINHNWKINSGLSWHHSMFANSFWGEDLYDEVVLDFIGPHLGIGYSW